MDKRKLLLIFIDAVVNLVIGTVLLLSPWGVLRLLGLPPTSCLFYPMILGAVILGIGLALLL